jgi:Ca2+-binding RTX toxin-like protein
VLNGSTGNDALYGNAGNDTLLGGAGSDFLRGDAGNDSIDGGVIADRINYTDGNTVSYANSTGAVNVNLSGITGTGSTGTGTASDGLGGTDTLANIFYVQGSSQDDTLVGSAALTLEVFEGRAGNDTINGGAITDTLNGENSNRVSYQNAAVAVNVNLATGTATSAADTGAGSDGNDTLININQVRGSSHADTLTGSDDLVLTEQFEGRAGADTIDGAGGLDLVRYDNAAAGVNVDLAGGTASDGYGTTDTLSNIEGARGSKFADTLSGGNAANDALEFFMGLEGNDTIDGGRGYDRAEYTLSTAGVNVTLGGAGSGTASDGYGTTDTLISIEGVRGSAFNDTLTGSNAADIFESFEGREGNDNINGMGGTDRVVYTASKAGVTVNLATGTASDGYGGTDSLNNIEDVLGSRDFNDSLTGSAADNKLEGQGGNDTLDGGLGNDSLLGGLGNDSLFGAAGADTLAAGPGLDTVDGGADADTLVVLGNFADYTRTRPNATDTRLVFAGTGEDITFRNVESVVFLDGTRTLADVHLNIVSANNDVIVGTPGNDTLDGLAGADTLVGLDGDDTYVVDVAGDVVTEGDGAGSGSDRVNVVFTAGGTYTLAANVEKATIANGTAGVNVTGNALDNVLLGNATANLLTGLGGNDTLDGNAGIDTLVGGLGNDSYTVDVPADVITELLGEGTDQVNVLFASAGTYILAANVENAQIGNPTPGVNLTGNGLGNNLAGNGQANLLAGLDGDDTLDGTAGNDTLDGGLGNDSLLGGLGNDSLFGAAGADTLAAGPGLDTVDGGADADTLVVLGNFADYTRTRPNATDTRLVFAGTGEDVTFRNVESVVFLDGTRTLADVHLNIVSANNDVIVGTPGNDTLDGLAGADTLVGLDGDDTYFVDVAGDVVTEGDGAGSGSDRVNVVFTAGGTYTLAANVENATIANGTAGVNVTGNALDNVLLGNATANLLTGLGGNDTLDGGLGIDTLVGGLGNDFYAIDTLADVVTENPGEGNDGVAVLLAAGATYTLAANVENAGIGNATPGVNLTGNALDNTLQGNSQANVLNGSTGNDALYGNAGNDTLLGGAGSDFLRGDAGNDSIDGGVIADRINYTDGNTVSYANSTGAVNVNLSGITGTGSTGTGTASDGLGGTDTLANIFYVQGSSQDDTLVGSAALTLEVFEGRAGNDTINGGAITDTLNGENSNRVSYQNAAVAVNVNLATGTATSAADTGAGSDGNDTLININQVRGSSHADTLTGSDDLVLTEQFEGRAGADTIDGAGGLDLVRYDNAAAGVNVDLAGGTASDGYGTTDTLSNIEGARGSKFADTLSGGNAANDALEFFMGLEGNDTIDGGRGYDRAEYTLSTAGVNVTLGGAGSGTASDGYGTTDTLISIEGVRGSAFNDTLTGSNAADIFESFEGREGNDNINGMGGTDRVVYTASKAGVTVNLATGTASDGYGGTDSLNNIEDVLGSRDFNDSLTGSAADNKLEGQGGNDTLDGGLGNDSLLGGLGNDSLFGAAGADTLAAGPGLDTVDGGADADTLVVLGNFADYTRTRPNATDTRLVNRRHRRRHHLPQRRVGRLPRRHPHTGRRPPQHRQRQ